VNNIVPAGPDFLVRKIHDLEARLDRMETANIGNATTVSGGTGLAVVAGGSVTLAGGSLIVQDPDGNQICSIGVDPLNPTTSGLVTRRTSGRVMLASEAVGYLGLVYTAVSDSGGSLVFCDDPVRGGLGFPYLALGQWVDNTPLGTPAAPTVSATFVTLQVAQVIRANPQVRVDAIVNSSSAGTTGDVQLLDPAGTPVGSPLSVPVNATSYITLGPTAWPAGWVTSDGGLCQLQARCTGGTGTIGIRGIGVWGVGS
jgi:hypothetical protein